MDETARAARFIPDADNKGATPLAFEQDLLAIVPRLRRFARALARDAADADDLCQTAIERALVRRDRFVPGTRLDSWMYRIMRNAWIDTARSRTRAAQTFVAEEAGAHVGDAGDRRIEARMELADVSRALNTLPDEQREAIALVLIEGLAYKEAAAVLDIPMGTLTSRLVRGRAALMDRLGEVA